MTPEAARVTPTQHGAWITPGSGAVFVPTLERAQVAAALAGPDFVVVPRAELVALYGDAPVDVPVIRRILGETK